MSTPEFLVDREYAKENQNKKIKFINLNNFYKNRNPSNDEIKKIYESNEDSFFESYKNIKFIELLPNKLTGSNEFDENFFNKINEIENNILDGKKINEIATSNSLEIIKTGEVNRRQLNLKGIEIKNLNKKVFDKMFTTNEANQSQLIDVENKYYVFEITSISNKKIALENKDVSNAIKAQFKLKDKFENNSIIIKEINSGVFNEKKMNEFAKKNNLEIKNIELKGFKENKIFSEEQVKFIFQINDGSLNLLTDNRLTKNFIIFSKNTTYGNLEKNSESFKKYKNQANINFTKEIYSTYDKSVNTKYNIILKDRVLERIKNSF